MITWNRPDSTPIETNDNPDNIAKAKSLGWTKAEAEKPKRTRRTKEEIEAAKGE